MRSEYHTHFLEGVLVIGFQTLRFQDTVLVNFESGLLHHPAWSTQEEPTHHGRIFGGSCEIAFHDEFDQLSASRGSSPLLFIDIQQQPQQQGLIRRFKWHGVITHSQSNNEKRDQTEGNKTYSKKQRIRGPQERENRFDYHVAEGNNREESA